jgi:hypothetical protein
MALDNSYMWFHPQLLENWFTFVMYQHAEMEIEFNQQPAERKDSMVKLIANALKD